MYKYFPNSLATIFYTSLSYNLFTLSVALQALNASTVVHDYHLLT